VDSGSGLESRGYNLDFTGEGELEDNLAMTICEMHIGVTDL
jgi:hypothetical protein